MMFWTSWVYPIVFVSLKKSYPSSFNKLVFTNVQISPCFLDSKCFYKLVLAHGLVIIFDNFSVF